jgi:hypothetical protein
MPRLVCVAHMNNLRGDGVEHASKEYKWQKKATATLLQNDGVLYRCDIDPLTWSLFPCCALYSRAVQQTTFSHSTIHQHNQYQESMKDIHSLLIYMSMSGAIELLH